MSERYITIDKGIKVGKIQGKEGWRPCIQVVGTEMIIVLSDPNLRASIEKEFAECEARNNAVE